VWTNSPSRYYKGSWTHYLKFDQHECVVQLCIVILINSFFFFPPILWIKIILGYFFICFMHLFISKSMYALFYVYIYFVICHNFQRFELVLISILLIIMSFHDFYSSMGNNTSVVISKILGCLPWIWVRI
jgi:hypothetical protein